jgi:hypothetical protein
VLSVFLACDDPDKTARLLTDRLGWRLEFATPADSDDSVHARHAEAGVVSQPLGQRPWGEIAFDAVIEGYKFPDLATASRTNGHIAPGQPG